MMDCWGGKRKRWGPVCFHAISRLAKIMILCQRSGWKLCLWGDEVLVHVHWTHPQNLCLPVVSVIWTVKLDEFTEENANQPRVTAEFNIMWQRMGWWRINEKFKNTNYLVENTFLTCSLWNHSPHWLDNIEWNWPSSTLELASFEMREVMEYQNPVQFGKCIMSIH